MQRTPRRTERGGVRARRAGAGCPPPEEALPAALSFYGADGCRAAGRDGRRAERGGPGGAGRPSGRAWFVAELLPDGRFGRGVAVDSFAAVVAVTADGACVLVDIPIGLPGEGGFDGGGFGGDGVGDGGGDGGGREGGDRLGPARACDREARALLGARRSSVFTPPARLALRAASYREAIDANRRAVGRGLSVQAWHICPRIADVDELLRQRRELHRRYREAHPEVCFAALDGWRPPAYPKRRPEGRRERLAVLASHVPDAERFFGEAVRAWPRAAVSPDDVLDSMVLAVAAREAAARGFPTLPERPPADAAGLRMEMVCPLPPPGTSPDRAGVAGQRIGLPAVAADIQGEARVGLEEGPRDRPCGCV